jgi:uncharacterized membrane protein
MPRVLAIAGSAWIVLFAAFVATGPWTYGTHALVQVELLLGLGVVLLATLAIVPAVRRYYGELLRRDVHVSRRVLAIAAMIVFLFLLRIVVAKFHALQVNAWDFSVNYDRPLERTAHGSFMHVEEIEGSLFGVHAHWLLLAFAPLYAIHATPYWLLILQAGAIAGGVLAAFVFVRRAANDDFIAIVVALAFLVNRYTAKALQYVFHPEVFYPLALFVVFWAFLEKRPRWFALALLLAASIKEDAIIPLFGFALTAALVYRRWKWAVAAMGVVGAVFAIDYALVLPRFAQAKPDQPWFAGYWGSYGDTLWSALLGILTSPMRVISRVVSGSLDVWASLAFVPLAGFGWLVAALPPLLIYCSADMDKLHYLTLYYSMPLLPAVFAAIPFAAQRLARGRRVAARCVAMLVLAASIALGAGYTVRAPHPDRTAIRPLVARTTSTIWIQGALFPHAGYEPRVKVLNERARFDGRAAFLFCTNCDPYIYKRDELASMIERLRNDPRYRAVTRGELVLFEPVSFAGDARTVGARTPRLP